MFRKSVWDGVCAVENQSVVFGFQCVDHEGFVLFLVITLLVNQALSLAVTKSLVVWLLCVSYEMSHVRNIISISLCRLKTVQL